MLSSNQAHRQPSLHRRHAKWKMALQSCPEVGKMARMSYAQVKGCGCLERDMTWARQSLKAALPAAGNRPCTEGHLGGPHGVHSHSTTLAFPENLCSSQLPTTQRTTHDTLDPPGPPSPSACSAFCSPRVQPLPPYPSCPLLPG